VTVRSGGFTPQASGTGGAASWDDLKDKPAAFPPSAHTHPIQDVDGLSTALGAKADVRDPGDLTLLFDNALA
jgi:hypothetical protein